MNKKKGDMNMDDLIKQSAIESENKIEESMKAESQAKNNNKKRKTSTVILTIIMVVLMVCSIVYNYIRLNEMSKIPEMSREEKLSSAKMYIYYVNYKIDRYYNEKGQYPRNLENVNETGDNLKYTQYEGGYELHYYSKKYDVEVIYNSKDNPNDLISRSNGGNNE